ncbi:hypothetical protein NWP96_02425 [Mycoplasmopsis cynos]|nr:hypothetical protein [Mycoplasmopsis cynos]
MVEHLTKPKEILKVQIPSLNNQGLVIDGVMQEIEYLDTNTNTKKTKLLFLVDLFPTKFGIKHLKNKGGNPWKLQLTIKIILNCEQGTIANWRLIHY